MNRSFAIDILTLRWLSGPGEAYDLCAHGAVCIRLGNAVLQGEVSLSAAGLHLLRTLQEDHAPDELAKLFPADGFFWETAGAELFLCSCPNGGFDGHVTHEDGFVRIALEGLPEVRVAQEAYRAEVNRFADAVERFYRESRPKIVEELQDQRWYPLFWEEWRRRRSAQ